VRHHRCRGRPARSRADRDRRRRHRRRVRRVSPGRPRRDRRARDRSGSAVRDGRVDLARAGPRVPDERLANDVPHRAGLGRPVRHARRRRRAGLVRSRRPRARDDARADRSSSSAGRASRAPGGSKGTELLSPAECAERSPLLDPSTVLGGYWIPSDGAGKGVKIVEALARRAQAPASASRAASPSPASIPPTAVSTRSRRRGPHRVRARVAVRRPVGADRRRDGRRADPARRGAAPARVDGPGAGARDLAGRHMGAASDRASPGHVAVLPAARGSLRRRQLPARADRHVTGRDPSARPSDAAVADAVHAVGLRSLRGGDGAAVPRVARTDASERPDALAQRDVLVHAGCRLGGRRERGGARSGSARRCG
jgi:hypothetical protein